MEKYEYQTLLDVQRDLVKTGLAPAYAGQLVMRALKRLEAGEAGLGSKFQARRPPNPTHGPVSGEQCVRIDAIPGQEEQLLVRLQRYRDQGWSVTQTQPFQDFAGGGKEVWYACPPGQVPMEQQPLILQATQEPLITEWSTVSF